MWRYIYQKLTGTGRQLELTLCQAEEEGNIEDVVESLSLHDKNRALLIAAKHRLYEVLIYLIEHSSNLQYVDSQNLIHVLIDKYDRYDQYNNTSKHDLFLQCVIKLVNAGVDVNQVNENELTPLFLAAYNGLYDVVIYMLKHGGIIHYGDSRRENLLHIVLYDYIHQRWDDSSRPNLLQCVSKLVDGGVDVNQMNVNNETPIVVAATAGLFEIVLYLLEQGVNAHCVGRRQDNLLHLLLNNYNSDAIIYDTTYIRDLLQCVIKLVNAGVGVNQKDAGGPFPIFIAVKKGLYDVVMYLLINGMDALNVDRYGYNILHYVLSDMCSFVKCDEKYIKLVNTLINTGIDINQPDDNGNTPIFYVATLEPSDEFRPSYAGKLYLLALKLGKGHDIHVRRKWALVNIFLEAGCNVNHQNKLGQTALMHHIKHQSDISILKLLISYSDLTLTDNNGDTALRYCVQYLMIDSTPVFKLLVDTGSDLVPRNNGVELFHILKCKRVWGFSYCTRLKLICNGVTAEGENMFHLLACVNYDYILNKCKWLLKNQIDINHPSSQTNTPIMIAAFLLNSRYLELFTRHPRLEINAQNKQGHTALHLCIIGFTMFKDGLNKRKVHDVVENYCRQIYPIYMACIDSLLGVIGIDVNIQDNGGRTCLMMAAMKNDRVLTRKLLQAGAIVSMLDFLGRSAIHYLNIYQSVFDLTCFKLLLSNDNTGLNLPCIDGNTIIQTALCFPFFWEPYRVVCFIRHLVAENCCLQTLVSSSVESSYRQIDRFELPLQERDKLRKLLYVSGAEGEEIMTTLIFDEEDNRNEDNRAICSRGREEYINFCSNISLKSLCRRIIRQTLGLGIKQKVRDLDLPHELNDFLQLKDVLHPHDYNVDQIDDDCNDFDDDDDYDGYDIDKDRDDDYSQYNYQYCSTDLELRQCFLETGDFPNGEHDADGYYTGSDDDDDDLF